MPFPSPAYDTEAIIMHSESYKKESFMKPRNVYVKTLCENLKLDIDIDFVIFLLDGAAEPDLFIIDGEDLERAFLNLIETMKHKWDDIAYLTWIKGHNGTHLNALIPHISHGLLGQPYKIIGYENNRIVKVNYSFNSLHKPMENSSSGCECLNNTHHVQGSIQTMKRELFPPYYTRLTSYCLRSFQRYESLWQTKMLSHHAKTLASDHLESNLSSLTQKISSLSNRISSDETDVESNSTAINDLRDEIDDLRDEIEELSKFKEEKNKELQQLRDTIEELKQSTMPTHEYVKRTETIPIYDYELIKARRRFMHQENNTALKFFKQHIKLRYETPVAVLVLK